MLRPALGGAGGRPRAPSLARRPRPNGRRTAAPLPAIIAPAAVAAPAALAARTSAGAVPVGRPTSVARAPRASRVRPGRVPTTTLPVAAAPLAEAVTAEGGARLLAADELPLLGLLVGLMRPGKVDVPWFAEVDAASLDALNPKAVLGRASRAPALAPAIARPSAA